MRRVALTIALALSGCSWAPQHPTLVSCERQACQVGFHCYRCTRARLKDDWEVSANPWTSGPEERTVTETVDIKLQDVGPLVPVR